MGTMARDWVPATRPDGRRWWPSFCSKVGNSVAHALVTLLKKSLPIDRPKKQARLAALRAIGRMRLTILYPPNGPRKIALGLFQQRQECARHIGDRYDRSTRQCRTVSPTGTMVS